MASDLDPKDKLSPWQLTILLAAVGIGSQIILAPAQLIKHAGQGAWISVALGAVAFFAATWLMLKLGEQFPDQNLVQYFPAVWGKLLGGIFLAWFVIIHLLQFITILHGFSRVIAFNLFFRTPEEAIAILFLFTCAYGAMQDWGTIIRIQQFIFFVVIPPLVALWLVALLNFSYDRLLPLLPDDPLTVLTGVPATWNFYSGYEVVLLIFPLIYRIGVKKAVAAGAAFGCMGVLFTTVTVLTIGVLSAKTAADMIYPTLVVIKGIEIPGTFVERLEVYMLIVWIPIVFDTMIILFAVPARVLAQSTRYSDHRRWILFFIPVVSVLFVLLDPINIATKTGEALTTLGWGFSFLVAPLTLLAAKLKYPYRKRDTDADIS
ncbi:MAG TPA: endospore germination permease [Selenomonadales bacterium]|nr:endospore germination permease [Selenomonadales bacterium]